MKKDGEVVIGVKVETKHFEQQIKQTEKELQELEKRFEETQNMKPYKGQEEDLEELGLKIEKTKNKLVDLNKKQDNVNKADLKIAENSFKDMGSTIEKTKDKLEEVNKTEFKKTENSFEGVSTSISKIIKKTAKWALAVFGIKIAYNAVKKAVSVLSQYDEQLATDIEYIQFALASTLKPIIEWLIKAVYQILQYVGSLIYSMTGINIFANATAKAFNKSTKEAKKLKKELTGIDKITKLSSDKSETKTPGLDLSKINTKISFDSAMESVNNFIDKAKEIFNRGFDTIKKNILKVLKELGFSDYFINAVSVTLNGIKEMLNGLIDVIKGVLNIIVGFISGDTKKVKEGISTLISGLKQIIVGFFDYCIGRLAIAISTILNLFGKILDAIGNFTKPIGEKLGKIGTTVGKTIKDVITGIPGFLSDTFNKIKGFFEDVGSKAGDLIGGAFEKAINLALDVVETILNGGISAINKLKSSLGVVGVSIPKLEKVKIPRLAKGGIVNNPGKGVMVGSAIAGERGAEWVQPLSDTEMLRKVGEAIGKFVKVPVDLSVQLDSRTIARVLKEVDNERKFALNGG